MEDERVAEGHVVTDMLNSSGTDSIEDTAEELECFVRAHLADVRKVLNTEVEKARAEIARHVLRIEMRPVSSLGERVHDAIAQADLDAVADLVRVVFLRHG